MRSIKTKILPGLLTLLCAAAPAAAIAQASAPPVAAPVPRPPAEPIDPISAAEALAAAPKATITNGVLKAVVLLPDAKKGFYRGTRFDWSGAIASLTYGDQEYYGLWFDQIAANVRDFVFFRGKVVSGPNTAMVGPVEAYDADNPPGWTDAAPGGAFLKIGVGILRKPTDGQPYSSFRAYDMVDGGVWRVRASKTKVEFTQTLSNAETGFGYIYTKTVELAARGPGLRISHSLKNTGAKPIVTTVFNHNFLTLGGAPSGPGFTMSVPFDIIPPARAPSAEAAVIAGKTVTYQRAQPDGQSVYAVMTGFGPTKADSKISLMNAAGAGYQVSGDTPLSGLTLWSIRPTISAEPFVTLDASPGKTVAWSWNYTYSRGR